MVVFGKLPLDRQSFEKSSPQSNYSKYISMQFRNNKYNYIFFYVRYLDLTDQDCVKASSYEIHKELELSNSHYKYHVTICTFSHWIFMSMKSKD